MYLPYKSNVSAKLSRSEAAAIFYKIIHKQDTFSELVHCVKQSRKQGCSAFKALKFLQKRCKSSSFIGWERWPMKLVTQPCNNLPRPCVVLPSVWAARRLLTKSALSKPALSAMIVGSWRKQSTPKLQKFQLNSLPGSFSFVESLSKCQISQTLWPIFFSGVF